MSARVFTVKAAPAGGGPKSLKEALELAKKTGVLEVPQGVQLTIDAGLPIEVKPHE